MNRLDDPLRVSPQGRLFLSRHKFCPWTGMPLAPLIGLRLGQFRIERAISTAGGFGVVYYARNIDQAEVEAAIKVLKPPHCYNKEMVRVFLYEAGLGRGLGVSQIPKIFNVAREPWPHITMEYIEGQSLQEEFDSLHEGLGDFEDPEWIDIDEARGMMLGIALALQASHARDLHHRDLKPLNVLLTDDRDGPPANWVKVIDWGIAMKLDNATAPENGAAPEGTAEIIQEKLGRMGSLPWMAPEQFSGQTDKRSDIYQFGLIAFELLTGEPAYDPPADELDVVQWQNIHKFAAPKDVRKLRKNVPRHLARVVERCLAKAPEDRFSDGGELAAALSVERLSMRIKMTIAALLVTLLFAAIYIYNIDRRPQSLPRFLAGQVNFPFPMMPDFDREEHEGLERPQVIATRLADLRKAADFELRHDEPLQDLTVSRWNGTGWDELPAGRFIEPLADGQRSRLHFRAFADEIAAMGEGGDPDGQYRFAVRGMLVRNRSVSPFEQEFSILIDETAPKIGALTVALPAGSGRAVPFGLKKSSPEATPPAESSEGNLRGEAFRVWVPPLGSDPIRLPLEIEVAEPNLEPTGWLRKASSASEPGVFVETHADRTTPQELRATRSIDGSYSLELPLLATPSELGAAQEIAVRVTDVAGNTTREAFTVIFDTGTRATMAESDPTVGQRKGGQASVTVQWGESRKLDPGDVEVEIRSPGGTKKRILDVPRIEVSSIDGRLVDIVFPLGDGTIGSDSALDGGAVWVKLSESFDNVPLGYRPAELGPFSLKTETPFALSHFDGDIRAEWDDGRDAALFLRLPYPDFGDPEVFLLDAVSLPRRLIIRQTEEERERHYSVDWAGAMWIGENGEGPSFTIEKDQKNHPEGIAVDLGRFAPRPVTKLQLVAPTFWAETTVNLPIVIRQAPILPEIPAVRIRFGGDDDGTVPPVSGDRDDRLVFEVSERTQARLEFAWRPTDRLLELGIRAVSGDAPSADPMVLTQDSIERKTPSAVSVPLQDASGKPLGEGIYLADGHLTDVYGNKRAFTIQLSLHGAPPEISTPGCPPGEECSIEQRDSDGAALAVIVRDPSGIRGLSVAVDGRELLPSDVPLADFLAAPEAQRFLEEQGLHIERVDRRAAPEGCILGVDFRYADLQVGDRKVVRIAARDRDLAERTTVRTLNVVCKTDSLPETVPFLGLEWHRVRLGDGVFYVSEYEVARGFYANPDSFWLESPRANRGVSALPEVERSPEEIWTWCRAHGLYLPTKSQWQQILNGPGGDWAEAVTATALADESRESTQRILAATRCKRPNGPVIQAVTRVDERPPGWEELQRTFPDMFSGALHLLGNVEEVIIDELPPGDAVPEFSKVGGNIIHELQDAIRSSTTGRWQGSKRMGFRPIVFHENYTDSKGRQWVANREFQRALAAKQHEK